MREKIKAKKQELKDIISAWFDDLLDIWGEMFDRHPFILGVIEGMCEVYITLMIFCFVMRVFFKRELGWVEIRR